ncbi:hypothetical protein Tco_1077805 [Tanacetum coccineum]
MDVKTAFLNEDLEEEIYMNQPEGFIAPEKRQGTRPDLAYAVSRLSRYHVVIEGYSDANWISDIKDSRSTSGYVFTLGEAAISWKSSKQTVIAKSMMESEFIALDKCREEAEWLHQFDEITYVREKWGHFKGNCRGRNSMTNTQTPPLATTVVNTTGAPVTNTVANHTERPEKFNGQNFNRWQQKMFFYLTALGLAWFLKETVPQVEPPGEDPLYNVYCKTTTAKELWESLECKYKTKDAGTKKFMVARFLDYKMVDSKNVICQVQDLHVLIHDIYAEGMTLSETFQAAAIIEKLPPSWVDFKNYLKHKRKEMSVKYLVVHLRIEEDNMLAQKDTYTPDSAKANLVEHAGSSSRSNLKGKGKDKRKNNKKSKGKSEYLAPKENMVNNDVDMIVMVSHVCAMISKVNLVAVDNGQKLYMGNSVIADIKSEGDVVLKMTSEKELKLTNVLVMP